ncbi:SseB family protein [Frankia sp. EI5c]|uniref:SseB family protein n=1 Tax=Frankia sp. EI5c TaxID=683316 RepID=UPI000824032E|nr:SseB family protein [Frankia sp. EI5c]
MSTDLLTPPGQGDDGRADAGLLAALRSGDRAALAAVLPGARVFVGVEARALATDAVTGADKQSDMVLVTLRTPSGSGALPVFSAVDVMASWRPSVRPVPVTLPDACAEAVRMGLAAVVIDLGGPAPVTLDVRPAAGGGSTGDAWRGPRPFEGGEAMWISSGAPVAEPARPRGGGPGVGERGRDSADEVIVTDDVGGLLRPRPVPLGARGRRRIRAVLAGLPAGTEVWPAELAQPMERGRPARPVLAVALGGQAGAGRGAARSGVDEMTAEIVRRLRSVIDSPSSRAATTADPSTADPSTAGAAAAEATALDTGTSAAGTAEADETETAVLVVDPTEVPAVRAHLGRGVRPPGRFASRLARART